MKKTKKILAVGKSTQAMIMTRRLAQMAARPSLSKEDVIRIEEEDMKLIYLNAGCQY